MTCAGSPASALPGGSFEAELLAVGAIEAFEGEDVQDLVDGRLVAALGEGPELGEEGVEDGVLLALERVGHGRRGKCLGGVTTMPPPAWPQPCGAS